MSIYTPLLEAVEHSGEVAGDPKEDLCEDVGGFCKDAVFEGEGSG